MKIHPICPNIYRRQNITSQNKNNYSCDTVTFGCSKDICFACKPFKNKIKIIFSDIDGTIGFMDDYVSDTTIETIEKLRRKLIPVILTTARNKKETEIITEQLLHQPDYTIILQGGAIIDKNGKYIFENSISEANGRKIVDWYKKEFKPEDNTHLIMHFENDTCSFSDVEFPWESVVDIQKVNSFDNLFSQKLLKAVLYRPNVNMTERVNQSFNQAGFDRLKILNTWTGQYEIFNEETSKDRAINQLLKRLHIKPETTMVIGDGENDIEMFDFIRNNNGLAVAMGNASCSVQSHANAITSPLETEGFTKAVRYLFDI